MIPGFSPSVALSGRLGRVEFDWGVFDPAVFWVQIRKDGPIVIGKGKEDEG